MDKRKLVIIGGGFAGTYIAKNLESEFDTTLIDEKDYFEYTPGVLRTIIQPSSIKKIQSKHKSYLRKTKLIIGEAKEIHRNYVLINNKKLKFDYLVLATGSGYSKVSGLNIISTIKAIELKENFVRLRKAKNVLIIGGGIAGVELAAEIATKYKNKKITLINKDSRLMPRQNRKASKYAEKFLRKNNVKVLLNQKIMKNYKNEYITDKGDKIYPDLTFLCLGIQPNSSLMEKNFPDKMDNSYIKTNKYMQLEGFNNIFVAGDVTNIKEEKLAQNAEEHAKVIVENLRNLENKEKLRKYQTNHRLMVISLGKYNGIITYKKFTIAGFITSLIKSLIEYWSMKNH